MYRLTYDGLVLHDPRLGDGSRCVTSARLTQESNRADSLSVEVPPTNPLHGSFSTMSPSHEVRMYDGRRELFRGRISGIDTAMDGTEKLSCEGQLAYLNDTILWDYGTYDDGSGWDLAPGNARELLLWYVAQHNRQADGSQYVTPGLVELDTTPLARSSTQHPTTGAEMRDKLLDAGYGYADMTTGPGDTRMLNVRVDGSGECSQDIEFGANLLDYARTADGSDTVTSIIPRGRRKVARPGGAGGEVEEDFYLDGSLDGAWGTSCHISGRAVSSDAGVAAHGVIQEVRSYDDASDQASLASAAAADLSGSRLVVESVEVSAVDLSLIDPSAEPIRLGQWVRVTARPLGVDTRMMCVKVEIDALDPSATRYTLGATRPSLTDASVVSQRTSRDVLSTGISAARAISEAAKAEAVQAANAAGERSRVFTSQPAPPYDVGDLWVNAPPGEGEVGSSILVCKAQAGGDGYSEDDWEPASGYTDDTVARQAAETAAGAQTTAREAREAASSVASTRALVASCETGEDDAAKVAAVASGTLERVDGASATVVFAEGNSAASPTLDVGGTGAAPILTGGANSAYWAAGAAVAFVFHGGAWNVASTPVYASTADVGDPGGRHVHVGAEYVDVMDGDRVQTRIGSDLIELGRDMDIPDDGDSTRSARVSLMNGVANFFATILTVARGVALKVLEIATPILRVRTDKMVSLSARHERAGSREYSNVLVNAYVDLTEGSDGAETGNAPVVSVTCVHCDESGAITDQTWALTHEGVHGPGGVAMPVYHAASMPQEADYAAAKPCVVACDDGTAWLIS